MSDFLCTGKNKRSILNHNFHFAVLLHFTDGQTENEDIMETLDWVYLPALISSATPKDPKRGQITWIIINSIFGIKKTTSQHLTMSRTLSRRYIIVKVYIQEMSSWTEIQRVYKTQNKKARLDRKHLKNPEQLWKSNLLSISFPNLSSRACFSIRKKKIKDRDTHKQAVRWLQ